MIFGKHEAICKFDQVGVSVHSVEQAREAEAGGADYLIAGHIFPTDCKKGLPAPGIDRKSMVFEDCNLSLLAEPAVQRLRSFDLSRNIDVTIEPALFDRIDPKLMEIALLNLFSNAFKFTDRIKKPIVEFGKTEVDGVSYYYVKDNGVGFDMSCANNLFGTFQRLHKTAEFPGTGIGLATCKTYYHSSWWLNLGYLRTI